MAIFRLAQIASDLVIDIKGYRARRAQDYSFFSLTHVVSVIDTRNLAEPRRSTRRFDVTVISSG